MAWNRASYESSVTRLCFSSTPYDEGWDADWKGRKLQGDPEMQRLLALESAVAPIPTWAHKIAHQIQGFPPCGWAFPEVVTTISANIGAGGRWSRWTPPTCYTVGPSRLDILARVALCLDGWLKDALSQDVAAVLGRHAPVELDWAGIVRKIGDILGEPAPGKRLLVRRLVARLRFWLRAPYEHLKADDNLRMGYLYTDAMGQNGGWDYFSFEDHDPTVKELDARIRATIDDADRWLELILCTWPCAPKVLRFLERVLVSIGSIRPGTSTAPLPLEADVPTGILPVAGTYLDSDTSRTLYHTALDVLGDFVSSGFDLPVAAAGTDLDTALAAGITQALGNPDPLKQWLAALLLMRSKLFSESFKSFHFTRNVHQSSTW